MDPVLEKVGVKIFVEAILKLYVRLLPHHLENNIRSKTKCGLQSRTNLISELQFLSGEVQLGPSLAGEFFSIFLFVFFIIFFYLVRLTSTIWSPFQPISNFLWVQM